ncbi:MAG TPA: PQQ-dependent sugar dehydrogenase [Gemmatimonadales bacterium]|nr:PQQ-dependent sugar dehydrogenase [Gemmatimonadales bacterium]
MSDILRFLGLVLFPVLLAGETAGCQASASQREFETSAGRVGLTTVVSGLEHPWSVAFLPEGGMLVTERPGRLRLVSSDGRLAEPIAGVPEVAASGQGGLLDVALDPDFASNRRIYLSYAEPGDGGAGTAVARARLAEGRLEDLTIVFRQRPKVGGANHFGSRLVFARDGLLFVTLGERNQRDQAQSLGDHLGTVVRIAPDGSVPKDNPFVGRRDALPEIWSYGHRNIQGAALHPETGRLWTVEHGPRGGDEVNIPASGRNHGWPVIGYGRHYSGARIGEGNRKEGMEQPVHYWDPSIATSGMAFYTGDAMPGWRGSLFVGGLTARQVSRLELDGDRVVREERLFEDLGRRIRDVRQGPDGKLYLLTDEGDGELLRVDPAAP